MSRQKTTQRHRVVIEIPLLATVDYDQLPDYMPEFGVKKHGVIGQVAVEALLGVLSRSTIDADFGFAENITVFSELEEDEARIIENDDDPEFID